MYYDLTISITPDRTPYLIAAGVLLWYLFAAVVIARGEWIRYNDDFERGMLWLISPLVLPFFVAGATLRRLGRVLGGDK